MSCEVIQKCGNIVESLTKEEILSAIAQATGQTSGSIDAEQAFISKLKEGNQGSTFKIWVGTYDEYNAVEVKDDNTLYIIRESDKNRLVCGVFGIDIKETGKTYNYSGGSV